jgi:hypothetical protein
VNGRVVATEYAFDRRAARDMSVTYTILVPQHPGTATESPHRT